jgi:phosphoribosylanthranilate isomerase
MWVKICGITRHQDALAACECGADALGFVFTRSRRRVDPDHEREWIRSISGVEKVGVFAYESPAYIRRVCTELELDTIQLHAPVTPAHRELLSCARLIAALDELDLGNVPRGFPCRILYDPSRGSGTPGSWKRLSIPCILAGGLTPENVRQAIGQAAPIGVDVSTGVEAACGIKDREKIRKFIQEAKV